MEFTRKLATRDRPEIENLPEIENPPERSRSLQRSRNPPEIKKNLQFITKAAIALACTAFKLRNSCVVKKGSG